MIIDDYDDEYFDDDEMIDEEALEKEKTKKSQAWRSIESLREEKALQKKLSREYDLEALEEWYFDDSEEDL